MPLQKATQSLPFAKGLDTKTDPKVSAKPTRLENLIFTSGDLSMRPGRKQLSATIDTGGQQTVGDGLFIASGGELVRLNSGAAYGLASGGAGWVTKAGPNTHLCTLSKSQTVRNSRTQSQFDQAQANGVVAIAWIETGGNQPGWHVATYDMASGIQYATAHTSSATAVAPRLVALGNIILVFAADPTNNALQTMTINTASPETITLQPVTRSDFWASGVTFDAIAYSPALAVVAYPSSGTNITLIGVNTSGAVTTSPAATVVAGIAGASGLKHGIFIQRDTAGFIYVMFGDDSDSSTQYFVRSSSFGAQLGKVAVVTNTNWSGGAAAFAVAASYESPVNQINVVMCNVAGLPSAFLGTAALGSSALLSGFGEIASTQGMWIASDYATFDGVPVLGLVNPDLFEVASGAAGLQASAFLANINAASTEAPVLIAKGLSQQSGVANTANPRACRPLANGPSVTFLFNEQGRLNYSSNSAATIVNTTPLGMSALRIKPATANSLPVVTIGKTDYIGGGLPRVYDGQLLTECGMSLWPGVNASLTVAGGGTLGAGTYLYQLVYSWVSARGELLRGIASPGVSTGAIAGSSKVTLHIQTMPLSSRDLINGVLFKLPLVAIEVYRTATNGTDLNRQSSVATPTFNVLTYADTTTGSINIVDNTADVSAGELLYTTGGVLDWEAPPAYALACEHQGRLLVVPSENPYSFMPSSEWVPGEQVRFSSFNVGYVPADTGPLTGIASLDGKLILLTQTAAYMTYGDGPDNLGNNQYPPVQRVISVDVGPLAGTPIVSTPMGLMYQSTKGIVLLDRALNTQFIGADVEAWSTGQWTLRSGLVLPQSQQIRFLLDPGSDLPGAQTGELVPSNGGVALVYDYFYNQWSVFPNYGGQASCLYQGNYTMVRSDGVVWQETPGLFLDNGAAYSSLVETEWVKVAGIQGFQRLWYVTLLGTYYSDFTLLFEVAYDFAGTNPLVPTYSEAVTLNGAGQFNLGGPFRVRHHIGHKLEAVKFRISATSVQGSGQGMGLSDLSFEYGVKRGVFKLPAAQTA